LRNNLSRRLSGFLLDRSCELRKYILRQITFQQQTAGISMNYPNRPGYKARSTSKAAAKAIEGRAMPLLERVYAVIKAAGANGATADECAKSLRASILSVRPRVSELAVMGRLTDTMQRRVNKSSGRYAIVWRAK
jgi:hypothetical protein